MKITNVHPALTALETAMANLIAAQQQVANTDSWLARSAKEVEPTRWTKDIEESLGNPEMLESLRILYDESALSAMSTWLTHDRHRSRLNDCHHALLDAIREVFTANDAISATSPIGWVKPIMETRCIEAVELREIPRVEAAIASNDSVYKRCYDILVTTFTAFAADLKQGGARRQYTTELVVPGQKHRSYLAQGVDLRNMRMVEFDDCVNSKHPASARLASLMEQVRPLLKAARLAESRLKGGQNPYDKDCSKINNGTINERQHANRLLDALHGKPYGYGPSTSQVEEQNERRRAYEGVRHEILIASRQLQALYEELCEALHAAVAETEQFLAEVQGDRCTTIDRWETLRICLNNCLAVDLELRALGRELKNLENLHRKDLSAGAGRQATATRYAEIERIYKIVPRPAVTDSQE